MLQFSSFVADALAQDAAPGLHRYLIVDTAATRPANMLVGLGLRGAAMDILTGEACQWRESASPVLLELPHSAMGRASRRVLEETSATWRFANCFLYVEGPAELSTMLRLLRDRTQAVLTQDVAVVLRFFDPRIFGALMEHLDAEQSNKILAAGVRWAMPGRHGELRLVCPPADAIGAFNPPLRLTSTQESALIDSGEADAVVDLLLNQNSAELLNLMPPEQHRRIGVALEPSRDFRIDQLRDQIAFCSLALALGEGFHRQEPWASALAEVAAGRRGLADAIARIAESEAA